MSDETLSFAIPSARSITNAADSVAALACLGGGQPDTAEKNDRPNRVPPDSVYGRLPRPASIPQKERHRVLVDHPDLPSQQARMAYSLLWDGEFLCTLHVREDTMILHASIASSGASDNRGRNAAAFQGVVMSVSISLHHDVPLGETPRDIKRGQYWVLDSPFPRILADDQIKILLCRVLHRLLRTNGLCIPFRFIATFRNFLLQPCLETGNYREALDVAIIAADIVINNTTSSQDNKKKAIFHAVGKVGEVLEAKGNFHHAAQVYLELITVWNVSSKDDMIICHQNAALAFKRSQEFELGEENYLKALVLTHETGANRSWNNFLKDDQVHDLFQKLLILYFEMVSTSTPVAGESPSKTAAGVRESAFLTAFLGLLYFAGFQPKDDDKLRDELLFQQERDIASAVKNMFTAPKQANRILMTATKSASTNGQSFRSAILSCWKPGKTITTHFPAWSSSDMHENMNKKVDKEAARSVVFDGVIFHCKQCSEPSCTVIELQGEAAFMCACPCETVEYCSNSCQRRHWRGGHRLSCPCRST